MVEVRHIVLTLVVTGAVWSSAAGQTPRFFPDDPIQVMPPPLAVTNPLDRSIDQLYDFLLQSSRPDRRPPTPAGAVNTLGDVPDSEWFTNRHALHRMSREELQRGPSSGEAPKLPFTVIGGKTTGIVPGLDVKDANGRRYIVKFDPKAYPELATAADVIVSRFLYAIGYNTPDNEIVYLKLSDFHLSPHATITLPNGGSRKLVWQDMEDLARSTSLTRDNYLRVMASLAIEGKPIGPFRYDGTRLDNPNDITSHENRRDLRGLYVFFAWLNNTDAKAGNTLDTVVVQNGTPVIRHHLIDFASALGSDGDRPKDPRLGHEFMLPKAGDALKGVATLGLTPQPWEETDYPHVPGVGHFVSTSFHPDRWTSNYPNPAFLSRCPDDDYWGAKQVMAFTDDDIRAIVETAQFSHPQSVDYIVATLAARRDKIGRVFFSKVLPLDHFRIENDELLFDDLAVKYQFQAPRSYEVKWSSFDNLKDANTPIAGSTSSRLPVEAANAAAGSYFSALIHLQNDLRKSVRVYIRKEGPAYKVVGIDRTW